ncbi:MAG: hypothetical protein P8R32_05485, partial [Candidatus Poseidoniia archaeon]|nr:hypothetical protein [Candidatus Poseidoniia archaeon]
MQTEQSLYSHTVFGTKFTTMLPPAGNHEVVLLAKCVESGDNETEDDCEDAEISILDNSTGEPFALEEINTVLSGGMHYVAKVTQDTWWTQDTHDLVKTQITVALGASGDITLVNVPNMTVESENILDALDDGIMFECEDGEETIDFEAVNDGWEDCWDGSDEPSDDDGDGSTDQRFECDNGDTYPLDYVNDGTWHCEDGEDEGEGDAGLFTSNCEDNEEEKERRCYETFEMIYETAILSMEAEASINLLFDFGTDPMNALDLPLDENKYWEGNLSSLTLSGDIGGEIDITRPELSICPDLNCDLLPEMQELYSGITDAFQELHDDEEFSITVDRNDDGLPDVITEWNDLFPVYIPETWMDAVFQEIADQAFCNEDESAQEGEDCDERAEEEYEKLNLRIENNRFAFGPYNLHDIEDFEPVPYAFETGVKESIKTADGETYEGYKVLPTDQCSENNPDRNEDDCNEEDSDDDDNDGGIIPDGQARSSHDGEDHDEDCEEGDIFCDSDITWFHDAETGHPAYINMDMPNLREEGYTIEMAPISYSEAEQKVEDNADAENPEKSELIEFDSSEVIENADELPGFGIMAAGASLLFVSRRFRK